MATTVPAAARALAVFEIFAREKRELLKSELARLLDLPESSCSDLLSTLYEIGYVARTVGSKRYYPTGRLIHIARAIAEYDGLGAIANEALALLCEKTGESCFFGEIDGTEVQIVAAHDGTHPFRYVANPGDRIAIHATSLGKALLSELDTPECARLLRLKPLRALTERTITSPELVERNIAAQRNDGWYMADEEGRVGLISIAVAGRIGDRLVGMSLAGPSDRMHSNKEAMVKAMLEVRETIFGNVADAPISRKPRKAGKAT